MNHIYRSIWNATTGAFVAVSENAKIGSKASAGSGADAVTRRARPRLRLIATYVMLAFGSNAVANPTGGAVAAGSATISGGAGSMVVKQTSQNAILNWQSFSIGANESVRFVQPNSAAVALNRVLGNDPSNIFGSLSANGKIFLVNPNGILFGSGATINVGGLVASTRDIQNNDFVAGRYKFSGNSTASILNQGTINAGDGGYVALLGANVSNEGVIAAKLGSITLAAGNAVTIDVAGDGLLNVSIDQGAVNALVQNGGMIQADGGQVLLSAKSAGNLLPAAVNNTGTIQAQTIENKSGTIRLLGDMKNGTVNVGGTLDASAPAARNLQGGNGGFIETSAAQVKVANGAKITTAAAPGNGATGTWLIDPHDYTIAASGGDITGLTLSTSLSASNVSIQSSSGATTAGNGDIHVYDTVSWSANKLTLTAARDININAVMTATGTSTLALNPATANGADAAVAGGTVNVGMAPNAGGFTGRVDFPGRSGNGILTINNTGYTVINSLGVQGSTSRTDLQGISGGLSGAYALGGNIDASATSGWNAGAGFLPLGTDATRFSGSLNGLGHTISNLFINRPATDRIGLFGVVGSSAVLSNLGLIGGSVAGASATGGFAGSNFGSLRSIYATSTVGGSDDDVGGLVGHNSGSIGNSYFAGVVTGAGIYVGGVVGYNLGSIDKSYTIGSVVAPYSGESSDYVGALVGNNSRGGSISNSHTSSAAMTGESASGLVGSNDGTIVNSYYNIGTTTINGGSKVGPYGLYNTQFQDWVTRGKRLSISDYSASLPLVGGYYQISTPQGLKDLLGFAENTGYKFRLTANLDLASVPGFYIPRFTAAEFNGAGFTLDHLYVNDPAGSSIGFIGELGSSSRLLGLGLTNVDVVGRFGVGGLVGYNAGEVSNSYVSGGVVSGRFLTGGFIGDNLGKISNSYATTTVIGGRSTGGLVGWNYFGAQINGSYATGAVTGVASAAFAANDIGGLVGSNSGASITGSYATGSVTGVLRVGGLVGGDYGGTIRNSFWDITVNSGIGGGTVTGAVGLSTANLQTKANFTGATAANGNVNPGWDFTNTWVMYEGNSAPLLRSFMTPLTVTANNAVKTYDGLAYNGAAGVSYSSTPNANLLGSVSYSSGINAGSSAIVPGGLYSNQQGYLLTYVNGALTVAPATLTQTANPLSIASGAVVPALSGAVSGFVNGETLGGVASGVLTFSTPASSASGPGSYAINGGGLTANNGNYIFVQAPGNATALSVGPPVQANAPLVLQVNTSTGTEAVLADTLSVMERRRADASSNGADASDPDSPLNGLQTAREGGSSGQ